MGRKNGRARETTGKAMKLTDKIKSVGKGLVVGVAMTGTLALGGCNSTMAGNYLASTVVDEWVRESVRGGMRDESAGNNYNGGREKPRIVARKWIDANNDGYAQSDEVHEKIEGPLDISKYGVKFELEGDRAETFGVYNPSEPVPRNSFIREGKECLIEKGRENVPKKIYVMARAENFIDGNGWAYHPEADFDIK